MNMEIKIVNNDELETNRLAFHLGSTYTLYGSIFTGWKMIKIITNQYPEGNIAFISNDDKYILQPVPYYLRILEDSTLEDSSILALQMIKEGNLPPAGKNFTYLLR